MDNTTLIRIVTGMLFAIVLVILIQRRRTRIWETRLKRDLQPRL